jgi:hypothetical protein
MTCAQPRSIIAFAIPTGEPCFSSKQPDVVLHFLWFATKFVLVCGPRERLNARLGAVQIIRKCQGFSNLSDALI